MPPISTFLLGTAVGSVLLILGIALGYWVGRKSIHADPPAQGQQFLEFLQAMSRWTSEFSGDVSKYQDQLSHIDQRVRAGNSSRDELLKMVTVMRDTNKQLKQRLETTEKRLELQTEQLVNCSTEARTDPLTGILNRRVFDNTLDNLMNDWQNQQEPFVVGLVDIDHFKRINDTYGHPAGDAVLQQVARMLESELPNVVCVARYGGEEFGILWKGTAEDAALQVDELRREVANFRLEHDGSSIEVTLSGGVAGVQSGEPGSLMLRRADQALYTSKQQGRNQVHLHDGKGCMLVSKDPAVLAVNQPPKIFPETGPESDESSMTNIQERLRRIVEEESQRLAER